MKKWVNEMIDLILDNILIFFLLLIIIFVLVSEVASTSKVERERKPDSSMFVYIEQADYWSVAYHKETGVMYAISNGEYNRGVFTVLVDEEGNPLLWNETYSEN